MAGTIKLDGTQFLEKVNNEFKITNSELKLKSTGNTIVDSSGNAVVSESGGNVTLTTDEANVGSNALVVNSSGDVGIGTSTINNRLVVESASAEQGITIRGGGYDALKIGMVNPGVSNDGIINVAIANALRFATNNTERMRIDHVGNLLFNSGYGSVATAYGCRAWVNFNGTGTVAIRASGNVSSITDFGTGNYGVNFATAMPDANYSAVRSVALAGNVLIPRGGNTSSSTLEIYVTNTSNTQVDPLEVHVSVFR